MWYQKSHIIYLGLWYFSLCKKFRYVIWSRSLLVVTFFRAAIWFATFSAWTKSSISFLQLWSFKSETTNMRVQNKLRIIHPLQDFITFFSVYKKTSIFTSRFFPFALSLWQLWTHHPQRIGSPLYARTFDNKCTQPLHISVGHLWLNYNQSGIISRTSIWSIDADTVTLSWSALWRLTKKRNIKCKDKNDNYAGLTGLKSLCRVQ